MVEVKYSAGVWRRLLDLFQAQKYWMEAIAAEFDLTVQTMKALDHIPPGGSVTMKELAAGMWCDASNATGIVDRLEERGLVERRASSEDRRVKCVVLTTAGKRLRRKLGERMAESPPAIAALSDEDQRALARILDAALANAVELQRHGDGGGEPA